MSKSIFAFGLAVLACGPALSAEHHRLPLPSERHVIELVRPPYSGAFVINNAYFTAKSPACSRWAAGERVTLWSGDWHGRCLDAVFYNVPRRQTCEMWCGSSW